MFEEEERLADEELAYWLAFDQIEGVGLGPRKIRFLHERLGSLRTAWNAGRDVLRYIPGFDEKLVAKLIASRQEIDPEAVLADLRKTSVDAIAYADIRYPSRLKEIHDPPAILYVNGNFDPAVLNWAAAVVGTRRPTSYGQRLAKEISRGLSENGVTVISGMALGIDSLAHWGAIEGGSKTIAVLPCGPDYCYPSSNRRLFKALIEEDRGCVISEYFPGMRPQSFSFPARNRIVSGLSRAVAVIEGGMSSGSLITARQAFEQNREVFAVPGRVDSLMSAGPNDLIVKDMAHLLRNYQDLLKEMNWIPSQNGRTVATLVELYGREREVYELLSAEPIHFDTLCERTGMAAGEMSATLTMLELAGIAGRAPGDWYALNKPGSVNDPLSG